MLDINKQIGHDVRIKAPYYTNTSHSHIQRYMENDFVGRFQQNLLRNDYARLGDTSWQQEDRFGKFQDLPTLRQPIHRTFYLFSCEAACTRLGQPALDPLDILSSGFVIRRIANGQTYGWMLEDGEAIGWRPVESEERDPDIYRRICRYGKRKLMHVEPAYSGEAIHPIHPTTSYDENKKRHTILYGYIPLGGNYYIKQTSGSSNNLNQQDVEKLGQEQLWPFGARKAEKWQSGDARQVNNGSPSRAFYYLIKTLVNRYHLGDESLEDNELLEEGLKGVYFYRDSSYYLFGTPLYFGVYLPGSEYYRMLYILTQAGEYSDYLRFFYVPLRQYSLYDYLKPCFDLEEKNPLIPWISEQDKKVDGIENTNPVFDRLPQHPEVASTGTMQLHFYLSQADAQELRTLLKQRLVVAAETTAREIPIAKFQQGENDIYHAIPFVLHKDKDGNEQITWGMQSPSIDFRVASLLDPEASRPSLIPMPSLRDLHKGMAKGASFLVPPDTMSMLSALKPSEGVSEDVVGVPNEGLGVQWICSFSIPIVTFVAMILLMIIVYILNFFFFWIPWVRVCLPFPRSD